MRRRMALAAVILTAAAFGVSVAIGLPRRPAELGAGLKATMFASAAALVLAVAIYVLVAWPGPPRKD